MMLTYLKLTLVNVLDHVLTLTRFLFGDWTKFGSYLHTTAVIMYSNNTCVHVQLMYMKTGNQYCAKYQKVDFEF